MKKICKITSLLLVIILMFTSTSLCVLADSGTKDKAVLLTALGVLKGNEAEKISAGEYLTRGEAAYYAVKISGHDNIPKATSYGFSDVSNSTDNADAIAYALSLGIVSPADEFHPDELVTCEQIMKMIDVGLGYTAIAEKFGGYAGGYMLLSQNLGFLNDLGVSAKSNISYSRLYQLLTNVIMANCIEIQDNFTYKTSTDKNILYDVFDVYRFNGKITANAVTSLNDPTGVGENHIKVENTLFDVATKDLYFDLSKKIGFDMNLWVKEHDMDGADEIICYELKTGVETQEIFSEDFVDFSNGELKYKVGNNATSRKVVIPGECNIIFNGKAVTTPISGDVFNGKWGNIVLVKENNKVVTMIITSYENYYVGGINKSEFMVYDNTTNNRSISFKGDNGELSEFAYFVNKTGAAMTFDEVTTGSVLSVAKNGDYYDVIVTKESVTGEVVSIGQEDGHGVVTVDANTYDLAPEMDESRIADIKAGGTYTLFLDAGGRVAAGVLVSSSKSGMDWVYLIDVIQNENTGDSELYFKIVTRTGKVTSLKNAKRIRIDGETFKENETDKIKNKFMQGTVVKSQVIKLSVDDAGDVNEVDTIYFNTQQENTGEAVRILGDDSVQRIWKGSPRTFGIDFALAGNVVIFSVPAGKAEKADKGNNSEYGVVTTDIWSTDSNYYVSAYNSDIYSRMAEAVVTTGSGGVDKSNQDYVTVVSDLIKSIDEDGNELTLIKAIQNGNEISLFVSDDRVLTMDPASYISASSSSVSGVPVQKGDAIRYSLDKEGKIAEIQMIFDASENQYVFSQSNSELNYYARFQTGMVRAYRLSDGYITAALDTSLPVDDPSNPQLITRTNNYKVVEVDMRGMKPMVMKRDMTAVKDWYNYGETDCSYMLMQNRYNEARTLVIYLYE